MDIITVLMENGANVNKVAPYREYRRTALQKAAASGTIQQVRILIHANADVNAPAGPNLGITALHSAAIGGHVWIALFLLRARPDVNALPANCDSRSALCGATENGRLDMVQLLLNVGANPDEAAVELATTNWHYVIANGLKDHHQSWRETGIVNSVKLLFVSSVFEMCRIVSLFTVKRSMFWNCMFCSVEFWMFVSWFISQCTTIIRYKVLCPTPLIAFGIKMGKEGRRNVVHLQWKG